MVQQTKDSTFTEYGLAHAESGLSNADKQHSISIAAKRTELQGSRNESPMEVSKSIGSNLPMETSESADEAAKISGTKRSIQSPPKSNGGAGHIVYVRRKPELELAKSNISDPEINASYCPHTMKSGEQDEATQQLTGRNDASYCPHKMKSVEQDEATQQLTGKNDASYCPHKMKSVEQDEATQQLTGKNDASYCPHTMKSVEQDEATQQLTGKNEPVICVSDFGPLHRASSPSFSFIRHSVSPSLGISSNITSPENAKHGGVNCINPSPEEPEVVRVTLWEEQYGRLQSLLKMLDESDQYEYVQMLRSLSSVELSRYAIELEKRAIKLSLEEAKETQRVRLIDAIGKYGNNVCTPSNLQEQLHK